MAVVLECEGLGVGAAVPVEDVVAVVDVVVEVVGSDVRVVDAAEVVEVELEKGVAMLFCITNSVEYSGDRFTASPLQQFTPPGVPGGYSQQKVLLLPHESTAKPYLKVSEEAVVSEMVKTEDGTQAALLASLI